MARSGVPTTPPISRTVDYGALVRNSWGDEWLKHETAYQFRSGRKFESSDYGTSGVYLPVSAIVRSGTLQAASKTSVTLDATNNGGPTDYVGKTITLLTGPGTGETATIVGYDETTKVAVVTPWDASDESTELAFYLELDDLGSGAVDTTALVGGVSATFTRATTATTINSSGTIVSVASGVARSYYDPTTLEYQGYLAEGARTNLCLQSQDFNTTWSNSVVVATNAAVAPDGTTTADTITDNSAVAYLASSQAFVVADDSNTYTFSIFVKKTSGATNTFGVNFGFSGGTPVSVNARLNTNTGVLFGVDTVENFPGYWRISGLLANNSSGNTTLTISVYPATGTNVGNDPGSDDAATVGTATVWGAQVELGAFASSYIPTTTASVTRNADVLTYPHSGGSPISGTLGTLFVEVSSSIGRSGLGRLVDFDNPFRSVLTDGTALYLNDGSSNVVSRTWSYSTSKQKGAAAWQASDSAAAAAVGGSVTSNSSFDGNLDIGSNFYIGNDSGGTAWFGAIRRIAYYSARKSNSVLQTLTTGSTTYNPLPNSTTTYSISA